MHGIIEMWISVVIQLTRTIVNPPWSIQELERVRRHAFEHTVSEGNLRDGYEKWGGIPRVVLDGAERTADLESDVKLRDSNALFGRLSDFAIKHYDEIIMDEDVYFHMVPRQGVNQQNDPSVEFMKPRYR
jgi:hypothetical protein